MESTEDKRASPRICPFNLHVDIIIENKNIIKKTKVLNISKSGVCVGPNTIIRQNYDIQITFTFQYDVMTIHSEIVRINSRECAFAFVFKNDRERDKFFDLYGKEIDLPGRCGPYTEKEEDAVRKKPEFDLDTILDPDHD